MEKITNLTPKYIITEARLHVAHGNSKIGNGIYAFSTLPGNEEYLLYAKGELLTNIPGTCSKHCKECFNNGCYACNSAKQYHNTVIPAWAENTLLLRSGKLKEELIKFFDQKAKTKNPVKIFRINVSGEIVSMEDLEMWNELAILYPQIKFGVYTKNFEALDEFMQKHKSTADNLCVNISQWHGCANSIIEKYSGHFNVFEYDDSNLKNNTLSEADKERLLKITHCPAVTSSGHHAKDKDGNDITCDKCGRCYRKTGKTTAVYAH